MFKIEMEVSIPACSAFPSFKMQYTYSLKKRYTRMSPERFQHLLTLVEPVIAKKPCRSRKPIPAAERLMVTLRYLATGDSQQSQSFTFRIGRAAISNILRETLQAIWDALNKAYLAPPSNTADWIHIAEKYEEEWNFPHCLGAIDGKHIMIECPANAGSAYYNYKNFHSIVLLAICDANYCFSFVDIGAYGGSNDASVLASSLYGSAFDTIPSTLNLPVPAKCGSKMLPYVLLGDDIFPLKPWLMKPYPGKHLDEAQRVYNYRLSRARRTVENAFGILTAKWRILRRAIKANVDLVDKIAKACVCLHNYLQLTDNARYIPAGFVDSEDSSGNIIPGNWRNATEADEGLRNLQRISSNRYTYEAGSSRSDFKDYLNNEGLVPWQWDHVRSCGQKL